MAGISDFAFRQNRALGRFPGRLTRATRPVPGTNWFSRTFFWLYGAYRNGNMTDDFPPGLVLGSSRATTTHTNDRGPTTNRDVAWTSAFAVRGSSPDANLIQVETEPVRRRGYPAMMYSFSRREGGPRQAYSPAVAGRMRGHFADFGTLCRAGQSVPTLRSCPKNVFIPVARYTDN